MRLDYTIRGNFFFSLQRCTEQVAEWRGSTIHSGLSRATKLKELSSFLGLASYYRNLWGLRWLGPSIDVTEKGRRMEKEETNKLGQFNSISAALCPNLPYVYCFLTKSNRANRYNRTWCRDSSSTDTTSTSVSGSRKWTKVYGWNVWLCMIMYDSVVTEYTSTHLDDRRINWSMTKKKKKTFAIVHVL